MLKIVRVGNPGPFIVERSLDICIVFVKSIFVGIEDGYRIFELCGGLISLRSTAMKPCKYVPQDRCAACIV